MSRKVKKSATCFKCGGELTVEVYETVNVTLDPELKERVLKGTLCPVTCPHCGLETYCNDKFLYHDMDKKLMIQLCDEKEIDSWHPIYTGDDETAELRKQIMGNHDFRSVLSYQELVEKIKMFDAGLDDLRVEIMKIKVGKQYCEGKPCGVTFITAVDDKLVFLINIQDEEKPLLIEVDKSEFEEITKYYPSKEAVRKMNLTYINYSVMPSIITTLLGGDSE